ncbi:MAG: hypothetical protein IT236_11205 [Bacteroidia bacterium]|nr:hypothetical protein [Bacteroidia bacterium]
MRKFILLLFLLASTKFTLAQTDGWRQLRLDSLKHHLASDSTWIYRFKIYRPFCAIDNRNSFISQIPINLRGFQLGIRYKEKHVFGFGVYRITPFSQRIFKITKPNNEVLNQSLRLNYTTLFYKFRLLDKRFFEIHLPVEIGMGRARARLFDSVREVIVKSEELRIYPAGTGIQLVLKPVKWIGISTIGGYRWVNEGSLKLNFNGWYYSFGLWLDLRQIYRDTKFYGFKKKQYRREVKKVLALPAN